MDEIPPESRIALGPLLGLVRRAGSRNRTSKELGTLHSRQNNFIKFLLKSKLGYNPKLSGYSQNTRNIIMACYAADLVSGENLLCMTLKAGIILRYLQAAAELSTHSNIMNPCLDSTGKQSKHIKDIIHEVKRWESVPDRREPLTKNMIEYIYIIKVLNLQSVRKIIYIWPWQIG